MTIAAHKERRVHIIQGEFFVSGDRDIVVTTILGSCVAACVRDPIAGIGGINHFLLPGRDQGATREIDERMGVHLMELLVNGLLKAGASRDRLEAKLFGGARTVKGLSDVGKTNIAFARRFLKDERIMFVGGDTGGDQGRRIQYWPVSGRARQVLLADKAIRAQSEYKIATPIVHNAGELELF
ncbi:MAG TPA: chemotaxis protein CheD [Hyphomicrobium sp.]|nr:chemotaxis protein CheD [Hyphomicrobium sp.]